MRFADGRVLLVSGGRDGELHRWDPFTGERIGRRDDAHEGGVISVQCGRRRPVELISSGADGVVRRWDALSGALLDEPLPGYCVTAWTAGDTVMIATGAVDDDDETITIRQFKAADPVYHSPQLFE